MSTLVLQRKSGITVLEQRTIPPEPVISAGSLSFVINLPREWMPIDLKEWDLQYQKSVDNTSFGDWIDLGTFQPTTGLGDIASTSDTESGTGGSYVHATAEPPPTPYYRYRYRLRTNFLQSEWSEAAFAGQGKALPLLPLPAPSVVSPSTLTENEVASGTLTSNSIQAGSIVSDSLYAGLVQANLIKAQNIAAGTITANEIAANTITANKITAHTITANEIAAGTITATQISAGTITGGLISAGTITATNIAAGTITGSLIAATTITASNIVSSTITATQIAASTITATQIAANTITASKIAAGTITSTEIAATTITAGNIAASTITGGKIAASTITATNIAASTITGSLIAANTITGSNLVVDTITATEIVGTTLSGIFADLGTVTAGTLRIGVLGGAKTAIGDNISTSSGTKSGIVGTDSSNNITFYMDSATGNLQLKGDIQTGSTGLGNISGAIDGTTNITSATISNSRLVANTITAAKIAAGTITTTEIAALTITAGNIAAGTITAAKISAGTITTAEIAADTITAGNIAANAITTSELNALAVTAAKIAANTITAAQIQAGTITGTEIAATTITGGKLVANTITAGQIAAGTITSTEIAAGAITTQKLSVTMGGSNMLSDSGFSKTGLPNWSASNATIASITGHARVGSPNLTAASVTATTAANASIRRTSSRVSAVAGLPYTASAYYEAATTGRNVTTYLDWYNSGGTRISVSSTSTTDTTGGQTRGSTTAIAPAGTVTVSAIYEITSPAAGEVHYITDAQLEPSDVLTAYRRLAGEILPGEVGTTEILPGSITTSLLSATAIDAMTITGATFRTSSSSSRVEINGTDGFFITTDNGVTKDVYLDSTGLQFLAGTETIASGRKIRFLHPSGGATAGEIYNTTNAAAVPTISNSTFDTNLTGWTLDTSSGTVTRDTTTTQSGAGSLRIDISVITGANTGGYTTFSGTFKAGITYRIPFWSRGPNSAGALRLYTDNTFATTLAKVDFPDSVGSFTKSYLEYKPTVDVVNPVLRISYATIGTLYVDTIGPAEIMTTAVTSAIAKTGGNDVASVSAQVIDSSSVRQGLTILTSEGSSDFLQLTGTAKRKVTFGSGIVTFTASSNSNLATITHGLGATPQTVICMPKNAATTRATIQEDQAADSTNFYVRGFQSQGNNVSVTLNFYWLAIG